MFDLLLPTMLAIDGATAVGRYHSVWDGLAGIAVGIVMRSIADRVMAAALNLRLPGRRIGVSLLPAGAPTVAPQED